MYLGPVVEALLALASNPSVGCCSTVRNLPMYREVLMPMHPREYRSYFRLLEIEVGRDSQVPYLTQSTSLPV